MSTEATPLRIKQLQASARLIQGRSPYESLRIRVPIYLILFVVALSYALISDLVFHIPTQTVANSLLPITVILLIFSPIAYRALSFRKEGQDWRTLAITQGLHQAAEIERFRQTCAEQAERLNEFEVERANIVFATNMALRYRLMNEGVGYQSKTPSRVVVGVPRNPVTPGEVLRQVLQGTKARAQ